MKKINPWMESYTGGGHCQRTLLPATVVVVEIKVNTLSEGIGSIAGCKNGLCGDDKIQLSLCLWPTRPVRTGAAKLAVGSDEVVLLPTHSRQSSKVHSHLPIS